MSQQIKNMEFIPIANSLIQERISLFKQNNGICLSNFFLADRESLYEIYEGEKTILLRKIEKDYFRLYVISADVDATLAILSHLDGETYVINIPTKASIEHWDILLKKANFSQLAEYHRYYNNKKLVHRDSAIGDYALEKDKHQISDLINSAFSKYTDYIASDEELTQLIANHQVIVTRDENENVCGAVLFDIEGKKSYLRMWIDKGNTGIFLLFRYYNEVVANGVNYVNFWVNAVNKNVIRLHTLFGAQADGLKDYTYIKNLK